MKKQHLPEKICPVCQRPFQWRKKWERNWEEVKYCSERCRRSKINRAPNEPRLTESFGQELPTNNEQR